MKNYENYISLGYFCGVASELRRISLRKYSSPFDWLITASFQKVIELIDNQFKDFLSSDYLKVLDEEKLFYTNEYYYINFLHDFSQGKSFDEQIDEVREKFFRRIGRFYSKIKFPTLFIRYILNQDEMDYIQSHYECIIGFFKQFNNQNDLIFVCNDTIDSKGIQVFKVKKDEGLNEASQFLDKNADLMNLLCSLGESTAETEFKPEQEDANGSKEQVDSNIASQDKELPNGSLSQGEEASLIDHLKNEIDQLNKKIMKSEVTITDQLNAIMYLQDKVIDLNDEFVQKENRNKEEKERLKAEIDTLQNKYLNLYSEHANSLNTWDAEKKHFENEIVKYNKLYLQYKDIVDQISGSITYRMMTPLRKIRKLFK